MKRMFSAIAAVAMLAAAPAIADEVWSAGEGFEIVYESEVGDYAVLSYPGEYEDDPRELAFIEDLAGNYDDRGRHDGYWVAEAVPQGEGGCDVSIIDHTGVETNVWGRVELIFLETSYPTGFVAQRGWCFEEPRDEIVARPLTAADYANEE
ncbi:MAG: hypothetical protein AAF216_09790 [Pseudomonadota bacterium]